MTISTFYSRVFFVTMGLAIMNGCQANNAEKILPAKNAAATTNFSKIIDATRNSKIQNIDEFATQLNLSYKLLRCDKTNNFISYCEYHITERLPSFGHFIILALGNDGAAGKAGGRIIWVADSDKGCISKESAFLLLGKGRGQNEILGEPFPGLKEPEENATGIEYAFDSIPNLDLRARATVSFRNDCVHQLFLDF